MPNANTVMALNLQPHHKWTPVQQKYLDILSQEENRNRPLKEIWELAGFTSSTTWYKAIKDEQFVSALESLGVKARRRSRWMAPNISVTLAEELAKDVWDLRRLKPDYPKHVAASTYALDFS